MKAQAKQIRYILSFFKIHVFYLILNKIKVNKKEQKVDEKTTEANNPNLENNNSK